MLSGHLLSGASAPATGELLRQLHANLARTLPEGFTEILADAVTATSLGNDRPYGRFFVELNLRPAHAAYRNPLDFCSVLAQSSNATAKLFRSTIFTGVGSSAGDCVSYLPGANAKISTIKVIAGPVTLFVTPGNPGLASQARHDSCPQSPMIRGVLSPGLAGN